MNLIDVTKKFQNDDACLGYLESLRWPDGLRCMRCESDMVSRITRRKSGKNKRSALFQCLHCGHQFSATSGTLFHDSHLPLSKWFLAVALVCNAKKGISAKQMERDLGVSYRTAWYLCHRIRKAMEEGELPKFTGVVEADETYVGGKFDKRRKRAAWGKTPVMGIIQRSGRVEAYKIPTPSRIILVGKIKDRVAPEAEMVITDQLAAYKSLRNAYRHQIINHIREWVRGSVHTNSIENFWSLFKRSVIGSYHQVSAKHLPRYLAEFTYRFNYRLSSDLFSMTLMCLLSKQGMAYNGVINAD